MTAIVQTGPDTTQMYYMYLSSWYICGNGVKYSNDYHSWATDTVRTSVNLVKPDQRPLPAAPLWKSPTFYPNVYDETVTYGIETYSNVFPRIVSCYGRRTRYDDYQVVYNDVGNAEFPNLYTGWMLALRKHIERDTVNLGTAMAEYRQTCSMFSKLGLNVFNGYKAIRGKLPKKSRKYLKTSDIPGAYLQYTYGVAPLVADTFEAYLALQLASTREIWRRKIVTKKDKGSNTYYAASGREVKAECTLSERAIVYYRLDPGNPTQMGTPVEWIWESIPYSFVLDWITDIGDILNSLDAMSGVTELTGSLIKKRTYLAVAQPLAGREIGRLNKYEKTAFVREILNKDNIPLPSFVPRYSPSKSVKAVVNGLALLAQIRRNDIDAAGQAARNKSGHRNYLRHLKAITQTKIGRKNRG